MVMNPTEKPVIKSCGFLVVRHLPRPAFLLMRHSDRWDLPKGHVDRGETELETALRELQEETGIATADIEVDPGFRFCDRYPVRLKRYNHATSPERARGIPCATVAAGESGVDRAQRIPVV